MQKSQESKIKMCRAVSGILTGFDEVVQRTPGLNEAHDKLDNLIEETEVHSQKQLDKGTELTTKKKDDRAELEAGIILVCAALAAYGTASADPAIKALKEKYQLSDSDIKKKRDMQLFSFAYTVYGDAQPYAVNLEPFATADEVAQLKTLADTFNESLPKKRLQQNKSALSTQNLEEAIAQIDLLLNDTIDILVKPWERKEPDFYKAYQNARYIGGNSSHKTAKTTETGAEVK